MTTLEIDATNFEKSLLLNQNRTLEEASTNEVIDNFINKKYKPPTVLVTPTPGFCVKVLLKNGEKVFINICYTPDIPRPEGMRIPMSIGHEREVCDKGGNPSKAFDVAVNSVFFSDISIQNELVIRSFIDAVADKYELELKSEEFHILKNLKCKGPIRPMEIEKRSIKKDVAAKQLITEMEDKNTTKTLDSPKMIPDYHIIKISINNPYYAVEIDLLKVLLLSEIMLQISEDRLYIVTSGKINYELDINFPELVNADLCRAEFDDEIQILTVLCPIR